MAVTRIKPARRTRQDHTCPLRLKAASAGPLNCASQGSPDRPGFDLARVALRIPRRCSAAAGHGDSPQAAAGMALAWSCCPAVGSHSCPRALTRAGLFLPAGSPRTGFDVSTSSAAPTGRSGWRSSVAIPRTWERGRRWRTSPVLRMLLRPTPNVLPSGLSRGLPTSIDKVGPFFGIDSQSDPDPRKVTCNLSLTVATSGDTGGRRYGGHRTHRPLLPVPPRSPCRPRPGRSQRRPGHRRAPRRHLAVPSRASPYSDPHEIIIETASARLTSPSRPERRPTVLPIAVR